MLRKIINLFRIDKEDELKEGFDISVVNLTDLDDDKVKLAYDNGIAGMKEIKDVMKLISTRTTLLLGYLATLVAAFAIFLFKYPYPHISFGIRRFTELDMLAISFVILTVILYLLLIFHVAVKLIASSFGAPTYNEPKNIIVPEMLKNDITLIKLIETSLLQGRIEFNTKLQNKLAKYLRNSILATFIIPVAVFLSVLFLGTLTPILDIIFGFLSVWV